MCALILQCLPTLLGCPPRLLWRRLLHAVAAVFIGEIPWKQVLVRSVQRLRASCCRLLLRCLHLSRRLLIAFHGLPRCYSLRGYGQAALIAAVLACALTLASQQRIPGANVCRLAERRGLRRWGLMMSQGACQLPSILLTCSACDRRPVSLAARHVQFGRASSLHICKTNQISNVKTL